ncbi:MAG: hypothetical protein ACK58L_17825 [Planctomycetota bacterium]
MRSLLMTAALLSLSLSGCHMCRWSNACYGVVDDISDCHDFDRRKLDRFYCEKLDVTRWGMNQPCPRSCCPHCK